LSANSNGSTSVAAPSTPVSSTTFPSANPLSNFPNVVTAGPDPVPSAPVSSAAVLSADPVSSFPSVVTTPEPVPSIAISSTKVSSETDPVPSSPTVVTSLLSKAAAALRPDEEQRKKAFKAQPSGKEVRLHVADERQKRSREKKVWEARSQDAQNSAASSQPESNDFEPTVEKVIDDMKNTIKEGQSVIDGVGAATANEAEY